MDIIDRLTVIYRSCGTYMDKGKARSVGRDEVTGLPIHTEITFATAFVRPHRFRFEYCMFSLAMKPCRHVIWMEGEKIRTRMDRDDSTQTSPSLGLALAAATGVSRGIAHTIPALLLPDEVRGRTLRHLADRTDLEDKIIGDRTFFRIRGLYGTSLMTVWIEKETLLVNFIERQIDGPRISSTRVYEYSPQINQSVPESALEWKDAY